MAFKRILIAIDESTFAAHAAASSEEHPLKNGAVDGLVIHRQSIATDSLSGDNANRGIGIYAGDGCMCLDLFELQHSVPSHWIEVLEYV